MDEGLAGGVLLDDLRAQIARGRVVAVIGAGVSMAATNGHSVASWTGLLEHGARQCEQVVPGLPVGWGDRVRGEIRSGDMDDLLSAAEKITQKLGGRSGGEYRRWLDETVGQLRVESRVILEALSNLEVPLATTNYDGLLEQALGREPVTWRDRARMLAVIRSDEPGILHLHGFWRDPESVVLGIRSYETVLGDAGAQALQQAMAVTRSLLFVGFGAGLTDPNFAALRRWFGVTFARAEHRHFRLVRLDEVEVAARQHAPDERILPLAYGDRHEDLAPFLHLLRSEPSPTLMPVAQALETSGPTRQGATALGARVDTAFEALAQLPPDLQDFTGRNEETTELRNLATPTGNRGRAIVVSAIYGKPGVGKSALAIHVAHLLTPEFPDAQLYANLRAPEAGRLDAKEVLGRFLRALGVGKGAIPDTVAECESLYRSRLKDRHVLVVIDNAANAAQVRPLIPASHTCHVLVTSREPLSALEGATTYPLEVMDSDEAVHLLGAIAGSERTETEPEAAVDVVRRCGYLPLAVRIAAAKLRTRPSWKLADLAQRLADERQRLGELRIGDLAVRATFRLSYESLQASKARTFRLLGLLPGPDFGASVVAALTGRELREVEEELEELVDAQLLEPAGESGRYRFHDLLRLFAQERLQGEESGVEQHRVLERMLRWYLGTAQTALTGRVTRASADVREEESDAQLWLRHEEINLVAAAKQASESGFSGLAQQLESVIEALAERKQPEVPGVTPITRQGIRPQLSTAVVRIRSQSGEVVGAGFLVDMRRVLTCAHVVANALNLPADSEGPNPDREVLLDFPLVPGAPHLTARVVLWLPPTADGKGDIAGLELTSEPPGNAGPARLLPLKEPWRQSVRTFGFPHRYNRGVWAEGKLVGWQGTGWIQMDTGRVGYQIGPGFSGAPVWDEALSGVVGITVAADRDPNVRAAFLVPTAALLEAWPDLQEQMIPSTPYPGLVAFRPEHAHLYFGREQLIRQLVTSVTTEPAVVVLGASGSGKSSLVFAGLIPQLDRQGGWKVVTLRPGTRPSLALASALLPLLEPEMSEAQRLLETPMLAGLLEHERLLEVVDRILDNLKLERLLLVIDQLEELYTLQESPVARGFLDILTQAVAAQGRRRAPRLSLLMTLRTDFLDRTLGHERLTELLQRATLFVGPMTRPQLRAAIERPAEGLATFEPGLVERLLDDMGEASSGSLPLLQVALEQLWARQDEGALTHSAYASLGGVGGAVSSYAENLYARLSESEKEHARRLFMRLVRPGERGQHTRATARRSELDEQLWRLAQQLATARLVTVDRDAAGNETVQLVHEALISGWARLGDWIAADISFLGWKEDLRFSIRRWERSGRDPGGLLRGALLAEAEHWLVERPDEIAPSEREFIYLSRKLHD